MELAWASSPRLIAIEVVAVDAHPRLVEERDVDAFAVGRPGVELAQLFSSCFFSRSETTAHVCSQSTLPVARSTQ